MSSRGIMDQRSRRIPREYPGSPGETKDPNRLPNSETDPGNDLNHQGADHVFLEIGPAIRILQLNIEGISAAKREILSAICSKQKNYFSASRKFMQKLMFPGADSILTITTSWHSQDINSMGELPMSGLT